MNAKRVFLVDGSGYIFRAFYAIAPLSTSSGFPTNALFGYSRMLKKLLVQANSDSVAVAFDAGRETFRLELYPQYKANRRECPSELIQQLPFFRDITSALGLPVLELPGFEADDVLGTLTARLVREGCEVVLVSGDKDLMQLVGPQVSMWDTMHDRRFGEKEVKEKFGVEPSKVVEVLALSGDASDNVPGVSGVGPKTAAQLIEKYGDVDAVLASVAAIRADKGIRNREKIALAIESGADLLRLSRRLVQISLDSPLKIQMEGRSVEVSELSGDEIIHGLRREAPHVARLRELGERFEFRSFLDDLPQIMPEDSKSVEDERAYHTIDAQGFCAWLEKLKGQSEFSFDLETTSLDPLEAKIVGVSFCWSPDEAFYVPLGHQSAPSQVDWEIFRDELSPIFADPRVKKAGQNLKYDIKVLACAGIAVEGAAFDSMVAAYLLNPDRGEYNLTVLANEYLGLAVIEYDDVVAGRENFSEVPVPDATRYAAQDAHYAWLLKEKLAPRLEAEGLAKVFSEIEMPLVWVLAQMELRGIGLDTQRLAGMSDEFASELDRIQRQIYALAGCEFNINSTRQLAEVLFGKLCISTKGLKKTKTGISTDSSVLEKISPLHPVPGLVLQYRSLHKLKSTYVDTLPAQLSPVTGRLHTHFNQTVTGTGRLSSSDPNLQNIPVKTAEGARIREAFVASPGCVLISADYSQIELRLLAHMSQDENMLAAFAAGIDIHAQTARELLGLAESEHLSAEQRRIGKTINFGIIYGMGPYRLARDLGIPLKVASSYIDNYFAHYPGVRSFFDRLAQQAEQQGFVRTIEGRKRLLSELDTSGRDQGFAARVAMNAPIQGSAADIIKRAMVNIERRVAREEFQLRMLLQIHDELLFESQESDLERAVSLVRNEMEHVVELAVPLKVELGSGLNWQQAQH